MSPLIRGDKVKVQNRLLHVMRELGRGAFGTVYQVRDTKSKEIYALKQVVCNDQSKIGWVKREIEMMAKAKHERIVPILGFDDNQACFRILTEFCSGGDLSSQLSKPSSDETNLKWIFQVAEALNYLHSRTPQIVHRDLKADNVLLKDESSEDLKLGDFGLVREYLATKSNVNNSAFPQTYYMKSVAGTTYCMAPEVFDERYTEKADIFSLGGVFYAILTRSYLKFMEQKKYGVFVTIPSLGKFGLGYAMAKFGQSIQVQFPSHFQGCKPMKRLIKNMLSYDPHERPTAAEVERCVNDIYTCKYS